MADFLTNTNEAQGYNEDVRGEFTDPEEILYEVGPPPAVSLSKAIEGMANPEEYRARVEAVAYLSEMLHIDPQDIYDNFDLYAKDLAGKEMPAQPFADYVKDVWEQSLKSSEIGLLGYQMSIDGESEELRSQVDELMSDIPDVSVSDQPFLRRMAGAVVNQVGLYYDARDEALRKGLALGGGFAGAAAVGGAPLVATGIGAPAYVSSVGGAFASGLTVGAVEGLTEHIGKVSGGHLYLELKRDGVDHDIAKWAAWAGTFIDSVIEVAQLTAIPGLDDMVGRTYKKMLVDGSLKAVFANNATRWAQRTAEETGEEILQAVSGAIIGRISRDLEEEINGSTVTRHSADEFFQELENIVIETPMSMGVLGLPGSITSTISDIRSVRGVKRAQAGVQAPEKTPEARQVPSDRQGRKEKIQGELQTIIGAFEADPKSVTEGEIERAIELYEEADMLAEEQSSPAAAGPEAWQMRKADYEARYSTEKSAQRTEAAELTAKNLKGKLKDVFSWDDTTARVATAYLGHYAEKAGMTVESYIQSRFYGTGFTAEGLQGAAQGKRGAVELSEIAGEIRGLVHVAEEADFSTFVHELFHIEERRAASGNPSVLSTEDVEVLHTWARSLTDDGDWQKVQSGQWTEEQFISEKTAQGLERYLKEGKAPTGKLREIFARIAELISSVYRGLKDTLPRLSPEVTAVFDKLYSDEHSGVWEAVTSKEKRAAEVLYQEGIERHEEAVQRAVREGRYVPDPVLEDYAGIEWADAEIEKRNSLIEEARGYTDADEFVVTMLATDPDRRPGEYYEKVFRRSQELGRQEKEVGRRWLRQMSREKAASYLAALKEVEDTTELPLKFIELSEEVIRSGELSEQGYRAFMAAVNTDPAGYMQKLHDALGPDSAIVVNTEGALWEPILEKERIRARDTTYQRNQAEIFRLQQKLKGYREALTSARAEAAKQTVAERKRIRSEIREKYHTKLYIDKMIRRIMKKPAASIAWKYQQQIRELQDKYYITRAQRRNAIRKHLMFLSDAGNNFAQRYLNKIIEKQALKEMTVEELEALDGQLEKLRTEGRAVRDRELLIKQMQVEKLKSRIYANLERIKPIIERQRKGSRQGKEEVKTGVWKSIQFTTYTPERVAEILDGNTADVFHEIFTEDINRMTDSYLKAVDSRVEPVLAFMREHGLTQAHLNKEIYAGYTRQDVIGFYIQKQNSLSLDALIFGDNISIQEINRAIALLSPEEKQLGDMFLEDFSDQNFHRLQEVLIDVRNEGMEQVNKYFPMLRQNGAYEQLAEKVMDDLLQASGKGYPVVRSGWRHSRIRMGRAHQLPIRHDAFNVWISQVEAQEKYMAFQQHIQLLSKALVRDRAVQEALRQIHGEKANEWIRGYLNDLATPNIYNDTTENVLRFLRQNMGLAYLGFNALTPFKQLASLAYVMGKSSPVDIAVSAGKFLKSPAEFINWISELDPQYKHRAQDPLLEELKKTTGKYSAYQQKMFRLGFAAIRLFDRIAYGIGWDAVFTAELRKARAENLGEAEAHERARERAQEELARTQPTAMVQNMPEMYRRSRDREMRKFLLMFSTQLNKIFNIMTYDMPNAARNGQAMQAVGYLSGMMVAALAMGVISRKRLPEDWKEVGEDIFSQVFNAIPFIGREIVQAASGWGTGLEVFPAIEQTGWSVKRLMNPDNEWTDDLDAVLDLILEMGTVVGFPQVQMNRVRKTLFTDDFQAQFDPWELLGSREEKTE